MRSAKYLVFPLTALAAAAWLVSIAVGQSRTPHIGYVYPAGGQPGTTIRAVVGGQFLNRAKQIDVSGQGVTGRVIQRSRQPRNLDADVRQELTCRLRERTLEQWDTLHAQGEADKPVPGWLTKRTEKDRARLAKLQEQYRKEREAARKAQARAENAKPTKQPNRPIDFRRDIGAYPIFDGLDQMSLWEAAHAEYLLRMARDPKRQLNQQLSDMLVVEITIEPDAEPGMRRLRLGDPRFGTNAVFFNVGIGPERRELEPNDPARTGLPALLPRRPAFELPVTVNGQIMPGDVDAFRFRAKRGQRLVIETRARALVPFLADAVPGWFQAVVSIHDTEGRELAFADDFRFDPDPLFCFQPPADGVYELRIRDSIYRGREDFVYRVSISERPVITGIFPLGGRRGEPTEVTLSGWNLPRTNLALDTGPAEAPRPPKGDSQSTASPEAGTKTDRQIISPSARAIRRAALGEGPFRGNEFLYAVDDLPECVEREPNNDRREAQPMTTPAIANGRIQRPGDVDVFQFDGKAGQQVVLEVTARRLRSPLDSLIRLTDADGKTIALNDDRVDKVGHLHRDMSYLTHHADSYLMAELPADGTYFARVSDVRQAGSPAHAYRLRISHPRPDFELIVTPSCVEIKPGAAAPLEVFALRRDGFAGPIDLAIPDSDVLKLHAARIPAGADSTRLTVAVPQWTKKRRAEPLMPTLAGTARIKGRNITRAARPADNVMQAFLWRHLAPAERLLIHAPNGGLLARRTDDEPVKIPLGGRASVALRASNTEGLKDVELTLDDPPAGISLERVALEEGAVRLELSADAEHAEIGRRETLIIQGERVRPASGNRREQRFSIGTLPAIPIEVRR